MHPVPAKYYSSDLTSENIKSIQPFHQANLSNISNMSSNTSMSEDSCQTVITTCAVVHHEQTPPKEGASGDDCVDARFVVDLPPYPSPPVSSNHSRQASEDFPPPPPSIDLEPLNEQLNQLQMLECSRKQQQQSMEMDAGQQILHQLQQQKQQHLAQNRNSMANWLRDLQMKQQAQRIAGKENPATVKDLASRFEGPTTARSGMKQYSSQELLNEPQGIPNPETISLSSVSSSTSSHHSNRMPPPEKLNEITVDTVDCAPANARKQHDMYLAKPRYDIAQSQIAEELREVEMLNTLVQQTLQNGVEKRAPAKKKSVSFCDQVILVATNDDDEEDNFIPNPILERVLRGANPSSADDAASVSSLDTKPTTMPPQASPPSSDSGVDVVETPITTKAYYNNNNNSTNDVINISQRPNNNNNSAEAKNYFSMDPQKALQMKQQLQSTLIPQTQDMQRQLMLQQQENQKLSALLMQEQRQNHSNQARIAMMRNQMNFTPSMELNRKMMSPPLVNSPLSPITNEIASPYMPVPNPGNFQQQPHQRMAMMNGNLPNLRQAMQHSPVNVPGSCSSPINGGMMMPQQQNGMVYQKPPQQQQMMNYGYPVNGQGQYQPQQQQQEQIVMMAPAPQPNGMTYMQPPNPAMLMMMKQQQQQQQMMMNPQQYQQQQQQMQINPPPQVKKVSFDVGTKGGPSEHLMMKKNLDGPGGAAAAGAGVAGMPTRNTTYNNPNPGPGGATAAAVVVKSSAKAVQCTLCRKKHVIAPAIYCSECDYYLSRFQGNPSPMGGVSGPATTVGSAATALRR